MLGEMPPVAILVEAVVNSVVILNMASYPFFGLNRFLSDPSSLTQICRACEESGITANPHRKISNFEMTAYSYHRFFVEF
jgi:hypothetical protein